MNHGGRTSGRSGAVLVLAIGSGLWAGCGGGELSAGTKGNHGPRGTVTSALTLPGGETIPNVTWSIDQGTTVILSGTYALPPTASGLTFALTTANVPAGNGYTLNVSGTSPDGMVTCAGTSAPFNVSAQNTTDVSVYLICTNTVS